MEAESGSSSQAGVCSRMAWARGGLGLKCYSGHSCCSIKGRFFLEWSQETENQEASRLGKKTQEALLVVKGKSGQL